MTKKGSSEISAVLEFFLSRGRHIRSPPGELLLGTPLVMARVILLQRRPMYTYVIRIFRPT